MNKEFVTYEQAVALKDLGFDEPCIAFYSPKEELYPVYQEPTKGPYFNNGSFIETLRAPLYQQAFRWFREKHNLFSHIVRDKGLNEGKIKYIGIYHKISERGNSPQNTCISHDTYEEAELACLKKLIKIVKNEQ